MEESSRRTGEGEDALDPAAVIIPARLESQRFPRKVLARETGKYLIEHVHDAVSDVPGVSRVIIATDSEEVLEAARSFGAEARLTSPRHRSGTDRVAEVAETLNEPVIINVQGDEPWIEKRDLVGLIEVLARGEVPMATLARARQDADGFRDPNQVKVVLGESGDALYFSRAGIPHVRDPAGGGGDWWHHIGIYGFRREFLLEFSRTPAGRLEEIEKLEQLRALENGHSIRVIETRHEYAGIDTPQEYADFVERWNARRETSSCASEVAPRSSGGSRDGIETRRI